MRMIHEQCYRCYYGCVNTHELERQRKLCPGADVPMSCFGQQPFSETLLQTPTILLDSYYRTNKISEDDDDSSLCQITYYPLPRDALGRETISCLNCASNALSSFATRLTNCATVNSRMKVRSRPNICSADYTTINCHGDGYDIMAGSVA